MPRGRDPPDKCEYKKVMAEQGQGGKMRGKKGNPKWWDSKV